jgi:3-hydroxybutyryl-CoA dehydrogenase
MSTNVARPTIAAIAENDPGKGLAALFPGADLAWMTSIPGQPEPSIAAYIDLDFAPDPDRIEKLSRLLPTLVFVNAVTPTLLEIGRPFIRINAWPGFGTRKLHELVLPGDPTGNGPDAAPDSRSATAPSDTNAAAINHRIATLYRELDCRYLNAPDIPGMISARVVAGIINEAWYTWEEKVSTKEEIDTAMRLGTNYPLGPFEWGDRIGLGEVAGLLRELSKTDERYKPARSLLDTARIGEKIG